MAPRRSIAGRRSSKSLGELKLTDVKYLIERSAPENERLRMLTRHALWMALDVAEKKCKEETTANPSSMASSACLESIDSAALPLYDDITLEAKTNTSIMEEYCPGYSEAKMELEEESMKWDSLKTHYGDCLKKEQGITVVSSTDSHSYEDVKEYDYSEVFDEISLITADKRHQNEMLKKMDNDLKRYRKLVNVLNHEKVERCIELNNGKTCDSPRALINRCISSAPEN